MAKRILVPLHEAVDADNMVKIIGMLARDAGASVRLLHVAPLPDTIVDDDGRVLAYADQEGERLEAEALDFLHAASIGLEGLAVECGVRFGDPVQQILEDAEAWGADLIAMTTRGRGCIERALMGSVAEQVFRKAPTAVTLYRAERELAA
jgi:nucleotide-binding universal stress UspA family protein